MSGFISTLYPTLPAGHWLCVWTNWDQRSHWSRAPADADRYALLRAADADVYVGMGLHTEDRGLKQRGRAEQVAAIPGVWADIDVAHGVHRKPNLPPDRAAALALLRELPLPWSLLVDSGHGFQVYWLLREAWVFATPEERRRAAALVAGWQALIRTRFGAQGWDVDSTADLSRVLRVAGTVNRKDPTDLCPVTLVEDTGARYTPLDFEAHIAAAGVTSLAARLGVPVTPVGGAPPTPGAARYQTGFASGAALLLAADAVPPHDKMELLRENDVKFRRTWERKRTDLRDQSASGYDYALGSLALRYGWADQEVANLLIAGRRKWGDNLHLEDDYYARTIYNLRVSVNQESAAEALAQGRAFDAEDRATTQAGRAPVDERADVLRSLTAMLCCPVARFLQHGDEQSRYTLVLEDGTEIALGTHKDLLSPDQTRGRILDRIGVVLPLIKKPAWVGIVGQLMSIRELVASEEQTRVETVRNWVRGYIARGIPEVNTTEELANEVQNSAPHIRRGRIYLSASHLRRWVVMTALEDMSLPDIRDHLRTAGFQQTKVSVRTGRRVMNRSFWHAPRESVEDPESAATDAAMVEA